MSTMLLPRDIYLDTSVIVDAIKVGSLNSAAGAAFVDELIARRCWIYFSQIVRLELTEALRKLATIPGRIADDLRHQFQLHDWERSLFVRRRWMQFGIQQFEALLGRFHEVFELPFDQETWSRSVSIMVNYQLRSHDAIHVGTALTHRLPCLAATDQHFRKITDLDIRLIRDEA